MVVEGASGFDLQSFDHRTARAIGETPAFVAVGGEDNPGSFDVGRLDVFELAGGAGDERRSDGKGDVGVAALFEEREQFVDHVVGGDEPVGGTREPGDCGGVVDIGGDVAREPGAGVDEDHQGDP